MRRTIRKIFFILFFSGYFTKDIVSWGRVLHKTIAGAVYSCGVEIRDAVIILKYGLGLYR